MEVKLTEVTNVQALPVASTYRDDSPYLTQNKAAKYLHVSERTLERLRHEGGGPRYRKAGRRVLYRPLDLDDWLDERAFDNTSEARANGVR